MTTDETRAALRKAIEHYVAFRTLHDRQVVNGAIAAYEAAIRAEAMPQWQDISMTLPEKRIRVLIDDGLLARIGYLDWDEGWKDDADAVLQHPPVRWMPLPARTGDA